MAENTKSILKIFIFVLLIAVCPPVFADNPLIYQKYTADPDASYFDGRVYIYCSHDQDDAEDYSAITDLTLISSDDLVNWTDHGEPIRMPEDSSWATMSWAPASVYRNGYYYVYFGNGANNIGVLRSTSPEGPFTDPIDGPLITRSMPNCDVDWVFDPGVFIDDDGQAYLYFGGGGEGHARVIRLNEDMISVNGEAATIDVPQFFEGLFMHKHNDTYYLSYSSDFSESAARIDYMTSDNPMTGFTYRGTILDNPSDNCYNNNHASIVKIEEDWYVAYHTRRLANLNGITCDDSIYQRSTALNRMYYNPDGSIQKVMPDTAGVAQLKYVDPYVENEAVTMDISSGIETEVCSEGGRNVGFIENGDWIRVTGVDFGDGASVFEARAASGGNGGSIEIRTDSPTGVLAGTCSVPVTGGWQTWQNVNCSVSGLSGVQDLYLRFTGGSGYLFNVKSYRFYQEGYTTPTSTATAVTPQTGGLRDLAASKGFLLGACTASNPLQNETIYRDTLAREFNWMGGENEFKAYLWSGPYSYNFSTTDYYRDFRDANNMEMRGHVLVYYTVVPGWMSEGSYTDAEVSDMLRAYIQAMAGRYSGKMNEWDVVNEAVTDGAPYGYRSDDFWHQRLGDYIPQAFQWAREADPNAKLFYNDYGNEGLNGKSDYIYDMVSGMVSDGVPIDGVGWQCHVSSSWRLNDDIWENAQRLTALGLDVTVTELDVAIPVPVDEAKLQSQAKAYADMTFFCMTHPNVNRMFLWGFTDKHSWIPGFTNGDSDAALIFDTDYNKKPAYYAIETVLGLQPVDGIYNGGFESSVYCWNEMSGGAITEETNIVYSGLKSARVYNRSQTYHGIGQYVLPYLLEQGQGDYDVSVWTRLAAGSDNVRLTLYIKDDSGDRYISLGSAAVDNTQWSEVSGSANVTWTGLLRVARLFVETENSTSDFYVDDMNFRSRIFGTPTDTPTSTFTPTHTPTLTVTFTPTATYTAVVSSEWRILAGSDASYIDSQGFTWSADTNYSGGTPYSTTNTVEGALPAESDQELYRSERYGDLFIYSLDVPAGEYQVILKFAETFFTEAGARTFDILINGVQVITDLDIYAEAGGAGQALDMVFDNIASSAGTITIEFGPADVDNAKVCALQVIPQFMVPTGTPTLIATNTETVTFTATNTETVVETFTFTATNTETVLETAVFTATPTTTAAVTATAESVSSATRTAVETITLTPVFTLTDTLTATMTRILPHTVEPTFTHTTTVTFAAVDTHTYTATPSVTITVTFTCTYTQTPQAAATHTITLTPVQAETPDEQSITDVLIYPNPYNPGNEWPLHIEFNIKQKNIDVVILRIYTGSFRLVKEFGSEGLNAYNDAVKGYIECDSRELNAMSNGTYYAVISAGKDGNVVQSKKSILIILK